MLDIESILVDQDGDTVCGENLEYDPLFLEIREAIEGKPEQQMGEDNFIEGEGPDWKLVKKNCIELSKKTHSLEVIISLTQALMNLEGYSGLADGSNLLSGAIEKYWDCLHPEIDPDDNDPIERLNMLAVFEDFNFLLSVQKVEILNSKGVGTVSLYNIRNPGTSTNEDGEESVDSNLIDAVFRSSSTEDKETALGYVEDSINNFQQISSSLKLQEHVGDSRAPSFEGLLKILKEVKSSIAKHLDSVSELIGEENIEAGMSTDSANTNVNTNIGSVGINSRQDVINAIQKIEDYYHQNEPGSPIPLLLQRAKSLVDKDFIALMEELAPDSLHQVEMIVGKPE